MTVECVTMMPGIDMVNEFGTCYYMKSGAEGSSVVECLDFGGKGPEFCSLQSGDAVISTSRCSQVYSNIQRYGWCGFPPVLKTDKS